MEAQRAKEVCNFMANALAKNMNSRRERKISTINLRDVTQRTGQSISTQDTIGNSAFMELSARNNTTRHQTARFQEIAIEEEEW